ncbi:unnamed protein product, partial [Symbiodinium sp. KB8]
AEEPSEQGEGGDDEDQEQAASAQTTDLVEDAPKGEQLQKTALEKNQDPAQAQQVLLDVLQKQLQMAANTTATVQNRWQKEFNAQNDQEAGALWEQLAEANQQVDKVMQKLEAARASVQAGPGQDEQLQKSEEELAAARRARGSAESVVEELDRVVVVLWGRWRQEFQANNSAKADEIDKKIDEIEAKREKAKKELEEAKKKLKEAEQKYDAKASVQ